MGQVDTAQNQRASYVAAISEFLEADSSAILGHLAAGEGGDVTAAQRGAWIEQIQVLKRSLRRDMPGTICFEFTIPRIGKRADNVLLLGDQVVVIEFKVGANVHDSSARTQVIDYALDLKNFHLGSHAAAVTPVLVATRAPNAVSQPGAAYGNIYPVALANATSLADALDEVDRRARPSTQSHAEWLSSGYRPTPTIIEASQALYRGHGVKDLTHFESGADNLGATTTAIAAEIDRARVDNKKVICLVSGVPGAGKTLAGLNLVSERRRSKTAELEHAVFLSGNGPLVSVLQEALSRDEVAQASKAGVKIKKTDADRKAVAFIQNVHHFRDECLKDERAPVERVVVFDEAQRAWDEAQTSKFMRQKRNRPDFSASEPEFLLGVMDRHDGWAAVVCLVGGGQEINTGEAGIEEWLRALRDHFPDWRVCISNQLNCSDYLRTFNLEDLGSRAAQFASLHLSVPLRSFRSERLAAGVAALMTGDSEATHHALTEVLPKFPIVLTRSLNAAKIWVRERARGSERFGLLASSGAKRLKPLGINMTAQIDPCVWFLNERSDVRSSFYMEDAASEFDVQGLELDWVVIVWDGDLVHQPDGWRCRSFKGTRWQEIHDEDAKRYRLNAYRVLLTRARQGIAVVVPEGSDLDPTRAHEYYDPTWSFLVGAGLPILGVPTSVTT